MPKYDDYDDYGHYDEMIDSYLDEYDSDTLSEYAKEMYRYITNCVCDDEECEGDCI